MLRAMHQHYSKQEYDAAAAIARDAAPYIHPRLSAVDQKLSGELNIGNVDAPVKETREEWLARKNAAAAGMAASAAPKAVH